MHSDQAEGHKARICEDVLLVVDSILKIPEQSQQHAVAEVKAEEFFDEIMMSSEWNRQWLFHYSPVLIRHKIH